MVLAFCNAFLCPFFFSCTVVLFQEAKLCLETEFVFVSNLFNTSSLWEFHKVKSTRNDVSQQATKEITYSKSMMDNHTTVIGRAE